MVFDVVRLRDDLHPYYIFNRDSVKTGLPVTRVNRFLSPTGAFSVSFDMAGRCRKRTAVVDFVNHESTIFPILLSTVPSVNIRLSVTC